jgi:hypothetical protein
MNHPNRCQASLLWFRRASTIPQMCEAPVYPPNGLGVKGTRFDAMPCIVKDFLLIVRTIGSNQRVWVQCQGSSKWLLLICPTT